MVEYQLLYLQVHVLRGRQPRHPHKAALGQRSPAPLQEGVRPEVEARQHREGQEERRQQPGVCKFSLFTVSSTESCSNLEDILCVCQ